MENDHLTPEEIFYRKSNLKKRQTIVFLHGLTGSSSNWISYEKIFEKKYNVISIDLRGNGKSFRPEYYKEYKIDNFADDVYKILKKEKIEKVILISHCFGNLVSMRFFTKYKKMVKGIVFISAYGNQSHRKILRNIFPLIFPPKILNKLPSIKKAGYEIDYRKFIPARDIDIKRMSEDILNTGFKPFLFILNQIFELDLIKDIKSINVPVLILHGSIDIITPLKDAFLVKKIIKSSRIKIIPNANHLLVLNNKKEILDNIKSFLNEIRTLE